MEFQPLFSSYVTLFSSPCFPSSSFSTSTPSSTSSKPSFPPGAARFAAGFSGAVLDFSCLLVPRGGKLLLLRWALHYEMAQRMVGSVYDWSTVKLALDVGCGRGILLNSVATQLKMTGSSGRVVGLDRSKRTTLSTLRTANIEGVGEYVTCKEGDVRSLPFRDNFFDVVVSAVFVHTVGKEYGHRTVEAAAERVRVLGEMVRVLKPCGVGVVWDLLHVPEYVRRLQELKMEDIRVSESVTAFMVSSHMVSFRKPNQHVVGPGEVRLDWRC
ncbi:hypothetical protein F3Y22_tig00012370pilonHSYRG00116 [Hibiscus syriacus]|uniref:Methyltransferase type 11 domain-containing protein n=1 Tax=Hibiscus syriacus TaxID=106335 RepID=A0A6A3C8N0_HIBSY|nr:hypothetical protein F3Y22_tig00012370pilonHSYRG00116 [Hibiscus syriacus]